MASPFVTFMSFMVKRAPAPRRSGGRPPQTPHNGHASPLRLRVSRAFQAKAVSRLPPMTRLPPPGLPPSTSICGGLLSPHQSPEIFMTA